MGVARKGNIAMGQETLNPPEMCFACTLVVLVDLIVQARTVPFFSGLTAESQITKLQPQAEAGKFRAQLETSLKGLSSAVQHIEKLQFELQATY